MAHSGICCRRQLGQRYIFAVTKCAQSFHARKRPLVERMSADDCGHQISCRVLDRHAGVCAVLVTMPRQEVFQ